MGQGWGHIPYVGAHPVGLSDGGSSLGAGHLGLLRIASSHAGPPWVQKGEKRGLLAALVLALCPSVLWLDGR